MDPRRRLLSQTLRLSPTADVIAFDMHALSHMKKCVVGASTCVCVCVRPVRVSKREQAADSGHWEIKEHFVMHP